jgi:hypothetical protein
MAQYRHHVFVRAFGETCSHQGGGVVSAAMKRAVEGERRVVAEHLVAGRLVERYRHCASPGDSGR